MPPKFPRVRAKRAQAAAPSKEVLEPGLQFNIFPSLDEPPAAKQSFHVKQDPSPRGRELARVSENNRIVSENLLDVIRSLCEDGVLDRIEWAESIIALGRVANGTE